MAIGDRRDWEARLGRRLRLRDLHILLAVIECGSMAKAAAHLRISQPAVSDSISHLEAAIGVRLLERNRRGIAPTPYGSALLRSSKAAFEELRNGVRQIESLADPSGGELRIATSESITSGILGPIIKCVSQRHPRLRLRVEQTTLGLKPIFPQLDDREVDLVVTRLDAALAERVAREQAVVPLFNDRIRLVAAKNGPWARRRKLDLAELAHAPWISATAEDIGGSAVANAFEARGLEPPLITVTTYSVHLRFSLAETANFIAVLPESVLRFASTGLHELPIDIPTPPWTVAIVTQTRTSNPAIARFIECAREVTRWNARPNHLGR